MNTAITTNTSPLADLAAKINDAHAQCEHAMNEGLQHALTAGQLLLKAKSQLKHGEWGPWLEANCRFAKRTAQAYMRVADRWPELEAKAQTSALLSLDGAVKLLAEPKPAADGAPPIIDVPDLSPDLVFRACGNQCDLIEIHPSPERPGHYHLSHYCLDSPDDSRVVYDRRPVKYTRELLADVLVRTHGFTPTTPWRSEPADGELPWHITCRRKPARAFPPPAVEVAQ